MIETQVQQRGKFREAITDAIGYWEPRRVLYNAVLTAIVVGYLAIYWPRSRSAVSFDGILVLFVLAVLANICYCAAYLGDVFVQASGFREVWRKKRWIVFLMGIILASILTRFFAIMFFGSGSTG